MGVGGAHKLLSAQRKDPSQSVYSVATTAQINANKNIFLHKNGAPKTVGQVYEILGDKINKTHNYRDNYKQTDEYKTRVASGDLKLPTVQTPEISNLPIPTISTNLAEQEQEQSDKEEELLAAKMDLQNKQNEENLFQDLLKASQLQYIDPNQVENETYTQQPQADEQGMYQSGGVIKDDNGYWNPENWGKPVEINSPQITMIGVSQPLLGISNQTGEKKLMMPGVKNYRFKNTQQVTEYPIN
jgi:hypothetical protein